MYKTAIINARINPTLKAAEAIRLFYTQLCLHHGLPFEVKIPNKTTQKAMHDADTGKTHKAKNINEIFDGLD